MTMHNNRLKTKTKTKKTVSSLSLGKTLSQDLHITGS